MLLVFVCCWLPINLINLLEDLEVEVHCWRWYAFSYFCCHLVAMASTCCNPFLYSRLNENFRFVFLH